MLNLILGGLKLRPMVSLKIETSRSSQLVHNSPPRLCWHLAIQGSLTGLQGILRTSLPGSGPFRAVDLAQLLVAY